MNVAASFQFWSLDSSLRQIRLIKRSSVEHKHDENDINIEVETVSLSDSPRFIALSYAWGDPAKNVRISCNQKDLYITSNLARALCTVFAAFDKGKTPGFQHGDTILLWADGICINQDDIEEKASQIPLMRDIYSKAQSVIAYIGAPQRSKPKAAFMATAQLGNAEIFLSQDRPERVTIQFDIVALHELWTQPWFNRSWVFQEMILAPDVMCLYGDGAEHASWPLSVIHTLIDRMQDMNNPHRQIPSGSGDLAFESDWKEIARHNMLSVDSWVKLRKMLQKSHNGLNPVTVAVHFRKADATDKRDKVYSLLGLLNDSHRSSIRVDYSEQHSLLKTFTTFAAFCLFSSNGIHLLEHGGISPDIPDLPSWAPDWSFEPRYPLYSELYRCTGLSIPNIQLWPQANPTAISVRGGIVDVIDAVRLPCSYIGPQPDSYLSQVDKRFQDMILVIMADQVARQMCVSVQQRIPELAQLNFTDIIWRTLTGDRNSINRDGRSTASDRRNYDAWCSVYRKGCEDEFGTTSLDTTSRDPVDLNAASLYAQHFQILTEQMMHGRMLCTTVEQGLLGVVPNDTRAGDIIAILLGSNLPFVLRFAGEPTDLTFKIVGTAYVHGIMDDELLGKYKDQWRIIIKDLIIK